MMDIIQTDFEQLEQFTARFLQQAKAVTTTQQSLYRTPQSLSQQVGTGQGADAFFNEMESELLPALNRPHRKDF